ncbi:MAG TPA: oligopeptide transporter, OPT family [bacterium]|nr:oligopeptide transporter, OPT family [Myxococcales bacterium]HQG12869.1 oligopeptide transporter, OPT family [bacterium]HQH80869.1 oligopeptide transporter, OPT family [bacterium]
MQEFKPYVQADTHLKDFSLKSIVIGVLLGILFGSANAYLGLRVGLTISTSIPLAVIAVAFFRMMRPIFGHTGILEANIVNTTGSASSSLASGVIFTIPALFLWGFSPSIFQIGTLALFGGVLGVLFMIPLRRFLIVKEHENLPYPEGTASAQVLIAAEAGGTHAKSVFLGLGVGAIYKAILGFLKVISAHVSVAIPVLRKAVIGLETSPALLGVGFILNYKIASVMVAGGLLSWVVLIPLIATFGEGFTVPFFPEMVKPIIEMSPDEIWTRYIRYIGAGAVAFAGIITVLKSIPTMYASLKVGLAELTKRGSLRESQLRTDRDLPMIIVFGGALLVIIAIAAMPHIIGAGGGIIIRILSAICIAAFAFLFVTVSSRIVGMVGVTSNPTSGMTIVALLGTSFLFALLGWTDDSAKAAALTVGTVVAVAASIAGDISQDLKTGYIIGATPAKQQFSEIFGAVCSAFFIAAAVWLLGEAFTFGSAELPAPQATLMKTVVEGVLQGNLPWGLVFIGAAISLVAELVGLKSLAFAVGIYLPLSTMMPVFIGGVIRRVVDYIRCKKESLAEDAKDQGLLFSSGLIAGEGIMGVAIAFYAFFLGKPKGIGFELTGASGQIASFAIFMALALFIFRMARKKA